MEPIKADKRTLLGKTSKKLTKEGIIPAVVYNSTGESTAIQISKGIAEKTVRESTRTSILDMDMAGKKIKSLIKEVQINPKSDQIVHISFQQIDDKAKMVFDVPIKLEGIAPAVKNNLGVLVQPLQAIQVRCVAADLVKQITVDISKLVNPGQIIFVKDLELPKGVELFHKEDSQAAIVSITELQKVAEKSTEEATTEEAATEEAKA